MIVLKAVLGLIIVLLLAVGMAKFIKAGKGGDSDES